MNINITDIVNSKLKEMEENKTIERLLEENIEKAITKGIESALDSYSLKRQIENKVEKQVSEVVSEIGFTAYNTFIAEKIKQITEGVCRNDIANKIQETFNNILIIKRNKIKLSEICEAYKEWLEESLDESEKYDLQNFFVSVDEDERYKWLNFKFAKEKPKYSYSSEDYSVSFTVHRGYNDENIGSIGTIRLEGNDISKRFNFKNLSNFESLIINTYYNETPIIIDVESEDDIENYFDIDN